jgi:hypothetical protein
MASENTQGAGQGKAEAGVHPKKGTLVDTLFDIGLSWAEFGVGQSKKALETSAKTLERAAHTLDDLEKKLRKDAAA